MLIKFLPTSEVAGGLVDLGAGRMSWGNELEQLQRQIEKPVRETDEQAHELYGFSDNERKLLKGQLNED